MNSRMWGIIGGFALVLALLSPFVLGSTKKVERLFEAAETLYGQNDYERAIAKYSEALKESYKLRAKTETIDKDFTTLVNFKIAVSYAKLAEHEDNPIHYEKALEHVEKAAQTVKLAEYEENLTYLWGHILYKTEQLEPALEKFTQLIENFPHSRFMEKAQEAMAQINEQLQDPEESGEIVVNPTDVIPLWINDLSKFEAFNKKKNRMFLVANQLRAEKQYVKAAEQYEVFATTNPSTEEAVYALYWAGWCYSEAASGDEMLFRKSRVAFQSLIDNYTGSPYILKAREKLSELDRRKAKKETDKVITTAENAVRLAEQSNCKSTAISEARTRLNNAKEEQERGNYEEARQLANYAQETAKNTTDNHETAKQDVNQGYTYLRKGQLETAIKKAKDALHIDPPYQDANKLLEKIKQKYFDQGVSYIEAQEYAKAIPLLKKSINIAPSKEAYGNLGWAYVKRGEFEQAITAAKKALAIDPNDELALKVIDSIDTSEN